MADPNQRSRPGSLDELLKANKEQFDRVFAGQTRDWGVTRGTPQPIPVAERPTAHSEVSEPEGVEALLDRLFGRGEWTSELVEKKATNGTMTALCRLKVNGTSSMHFGSAPIEGDEVAALKLASDEALRKCADELTKGSEAGAAPAVEIAPRAEPAPRTQPKPRTGGRLDTITLDLIENALRNARHEMDAVLFRSAMSPVIREQHDEFPMITDAKGRMIVGQFGSYVTEMLRTQNFELFPGDVILQSDPYQCGGAISHINDWMVLIPIFFEDEIVGFSSMFGHMMDVGGPVPGSMPTAATTIFGEGLRIPPIKIYEKGVANKSAIDVIMNNTRTPEMNHSDLMAIIAGSRAGEKRVMEICARFGKDTYKRACEALLERTERAMRKLIVQNLPEEPQSFEDYVDDDGLGNGPFRMRLTVWREGEHAYFDWTGTAAQAPGPINFYLHEGMFKMFIGVYMIMVFDPQILFNDGFYDLIHVTMPNGSLLHPEFPAALGCRTHALSRQFDVLGGALSKNAPEMATAAGYGSSPHFLYSGTDAKGRPFQLMEILYGGIPGRPVGDGMDGHSWWPLFENIPTEYLESYYPMMIESYASIPDTGGAGQHRGGNGVEKIYHLLEDGEVSIHDDRHATQPWGILGGRPGACSSKVLIRADGTREDLPSKIDNVKVSNGDRIVFRTAGGGGWGDPLAREPRRVRNDVARKLMSAAVAREQYGVVLSGDGHDLDERATDELRDGLRHARGTLPVFDFGERPSGRNGNGGQGANGAMTQS
ncbi:MAG: hydantoinase B/oxoprolinase family protein [Alphaproteobacteria bacterium]|nr:hydantoinase B/oxoprolinase family protein [Alphaproteobacteria bacterium]